MQQGCTSQISRQLHFLHGNLNSAISISLSRNFSSKALRTSEQVAKLVAIVSVHIDARISTPCKPNARTKTGTFGALSLRASGVRVSTKPGWPPIVCAIISQARGVRGIRM